MSFREELIKVSDRLDDKEDILVSVQSRLFSSAMLHLKYCVIHRDMMSVSVRKWLKEEGFDVDEGTDDYYMVYW